ncbi:hypothetical protein Tco_1395792, partial [Tanacetum coccineum]
CLAKVSLDCRVESALLHA